MVSVRGTARIAKTPLNSPLPRHPIPLLVRPLAGVERRERWAAVALHSKSGKWPPRPVFLPSAPRLLFCAGDLVTSRNDIARLIESPVNNTHSSLGNLAYNTPSASAFINSCGIVTSLEKLSVAVEVVLRVPGVRFPCVSFAQLPSSERRSIKQSSAITDSQFCKMKIYGQSLLVLQILLGTT